MSISVSTSTYIGIQVTYEDFVTTVQLEERSCPTHGPVETKCCGECGVFASYRLKRTPTPHLLALAEQVDIAPQLFMEEASLSRLIDEGFMIHVADKSWYDDAKHFLLGLRVGGISYVTDDPEGTESLPIPDLMRIYERVRALVTACGFDAEGIRLFHTASVG